MGAYLSCNIKGCSACMCFFGYNKHQCVRLSHSGLRRLQHFVTKTNEAIPEAAREPFIRLSLTSSLKQCELSTAFSKCVNVIQQKETGRIEISLAHVHGILCCKLTVVVLMSPCFVDIVMSHGRN